MLKPQADSPLWFWDHVPGNWERSYYVREQWRKEVVREFTHKYLCPSINKPTTSISLRFWEHITTVDENSHYEFKQLTEEWMRSSDEILFSTFVRKKQLEYNQ